MDSIEGGVDIKLTIILSFTCLVIHLEIRNGPGLTLNMSGAMRWVGNKRQSKVSIHCGTLQEI